MNRLLLSRMALKDGPLSCRLKETTSQLTANRLCKWNSK